MRLFALYIVVTWNLFSVGGAWAAAVWTECHNCSSGQYVDAAVGATNSPAKVFVYDFGRGNLTKFRVNVERDASFGWVVKSALPGTVGARKQRQWEEAVALYEAALAAPIYDAPAGMGDSAYGVVNDDNAHQDLMDYYRELRGWMWQWDRIQMVLTALQNRISNVDFIVVFQWPDGSFLRLKFVSLDTVTGTIHVVPDYAEDGDGNVIHTQQQAGAYIGDSGETTNAGALTDYWTELGISWSVDGGQIPSGRCSFRCTANECILQCSNE